MLTTSADEERRCQASVPQVYSIQDRRSSDRVKCPWVVRWSVDGRQRSKSFHTRSEADRFRLPPMSKVDARKPSCGTT